MCSNNTSGIDELRESLSGKIKEMCCKEHENKGSMLYSGAQLQKMSQKMREIEES